MRTALLLIVACILTSCSLNSGSKVALTGTCTPWSSNQGMLQFEEWQRKIEALWPTAGPLVSYGGKCVMDDGTEWVSIMLHNFTDEPSFLLHLDAEGELLEKFDGISGFTGDRETGKPLLVSNGSIMLVVSTFSKTADEDDDPVILEYAMVDLRTGEHRDATPEEKAAFPEPYSVF